MYEAALVLEGGGMRGLYTAGVLDYFLENNIMFKNIYAVSAGACHMTSYMSRQKGRARRISLDYLKDKHYASYYSLIRTGNYFGVDMCYNRIPNELDPIDYDAFASYEGNGYVVVTNIVTGEPEYVQIKNLREELDYVRASASLPLVSKNVEINGKLYLDGGMADSIPIRKAVEDGNDKIVVVLTRPSDYRKTPASAMWLIRLLYRRYPGLVKDMEMRHIRYNEALDYIEELERDKKIFVYRPKFSADVERIEKDRKKLEVLYKQGYDDSVECGNELMEFLMR